MGFFDIFKKKKAKTESLDLNDNASIVEESVVDNVHEIAVQPIDNNQQYEPSINEESKEEVKSKKATLVNKDGSWNLNFFVENNLINEKVINYIEENCDSLFMPIATLVVTDGVPTASVLIEYTYKISKERADSILKDLIEFGIASPLIGDGSLVNIICKSQEELYSMLNQFQVPVHAKDESIDAQKVISDYMEYQSIAPLLEIEYPRRKQIYEESLQIIQKTNNLETFLSRIKDVNDYIGWLSDNFDTPLLSKYIQLNIDGENVSTEDFFKEFQSMLNDNILRIVSANYESIKMEISRLKQQKSKESRIIKLYGVIEKASNSLFDAQNKEEIEDKLNSMRLDVDEYYNQMNN